MFGKWVALPTQTEWLRHNVDFILYSYSRSFTAANPPTEEQAIDLFGLIIFTPEYISQFRVFSSIYIHQSEYRDVPAAAAMEKKFRESLANRLNLRYLSVSSHPPHSSSPPPFKLLLQTSGNRPSPAEDPPHFPWTWNNSCPTLQFGIRSCPLNKNPTPTNRRSCHFGTKATRSLSYEFKFAFKLFILFPGLTVNHVSLAMMGPLRRNANVKVQKFDGNSRVEKELLLASSPLSAH